MQPVNLFNLASQQARWLSVGQTAIAGNVANADTPGYQRMEVEPFERVLDKTRVRLAATQPGHVLAGASADSFQVRRDDSAVDMLPSGNTVVLETEMMKAGELRRSFELNTAIVKSFHRMILISARA